MDEIAQRYLDNVPPNWTGTSRFRPDENVVKPSTVWPHGLSEIMAALPPYGLSLYFEWMPGGMGTGWYGAPYSIHLQEMELAGD